MMMEGGGGKNYRKFTDVICERPLIVADSGELEILVYQFVKRYSHIIDHYAKQHTTHFDDDGATDYTDTF